MTRVRLPKLPWKSDSGDSCWRMYELDPWLLVLIVVVSMESSIVSRTVAEFYPNASTQQHGLQVGDTILAVNGRRCLWPMM